MRFLYSILLFSALVRMWGFFNLMNFKRYLFLVDIVFSKLDIAVLHGLLVNLNFLFESFLFGPYKYRSNLNFSKKLMDLSVPLLLMQNIWFYSLEKQSRITFSWPILVHFFSDMLDIELRVLENVRSYLKLGLVIKDIWCAIAR